ncbi:MAG: MerR family transcriptional regulator [Clostridium sp.]|nr:MerR family transcriptional regulator [Clostridium sp.]
MRINEVVQQVNLSKRAVKYYEEQGLLEVEKDTNGYRNYTEETIETLKEISVYRKLGIGIHHIKTLLKSEDYRLLKDIYEEKRSQMEGRQKELEALEAFIRKHDVNGIYEVLDYETIGKALQDMVPGFYGFYFMNHFMPYLQIPITTEEQRQAFRNIIDFWDNTDIRIPLFMRLVSYIMYLVLPKPTMEQLVQKMDAQIQKYLNTSEEEYETLREATRKNVKRKNSLFFKYHPAFVSQRKFMKRLQDQGYNDVFIPNMKALSPGYKLYHNALTSINDRICRDLNLYYDSDFNLVMKKKGGR